MVDQESTGFPPSPPQRAVTTALHRLGLDGTPEYTVGAGGGPCLNAPGAMLLQLNEERMLGLELLEQSLVGAWPASSPTGPGWRRSP